MDDPEVVQQDFPRLLGIFAELLVFEDLRHEQLTVWGKTENIVRVALRVVFCFPTRKYAIELRDGHIIYSD